MDHRAYHSKKHTLTHTQACDCPIGQNHWVEEEETKDCEECKNARGSIYG